MHIQIITPEEILYEGEIKLVQLPGTTGSFEILNNHAPLVSTLKAGILRIIENNDKTIQYEISGGIVQVTNNTISVLTT